jgi:hypothetical protein
VEARLRGRRPAQGAGRGGDGGSGHPFRCCVSPPAEAQGSSAAGNLTFYTVSVVRVVPGGGPPGEGVVVLMVDGKVYMPFLWETAAFLALTVGHRGRCVARGVLVGFGELGGGGA